MSKRSLFSAFVLLLALVALPTKALVVTSFDSGEHGDIEFALLINDDMTPFDSVFEFELSQDSILSFAGTAVGTSSVTLSLVGEMGAITESIFASGAVLQLFGLELDAGSYSYEVSSGPAALGDTFTFSSTVTPVPEPSVYAMLAAGLGVVGFAARRRQRNK